MEIDLLRKLNGFSIMLKDSGKGQDGKPEFFKTPEKSNWSFRMRASHAAARVGGIFAYCPELHKLAMLFCTLK